VRVHLLAGRAQYARHLQAIFKHLPAALRGTELLGVQATTRDIGRHDVVMVGGWSDIGRCGSHRLIYVEHGAGQSYNGSPESANSYGYAGTTQHPPNVIGYIAPRQDVADSWLRPAFAAGCPAIDACSTAHYDGPPLAAITFHWGADHPLCAEAGTALGHWQPHLGAMVAHVRACGFEPVGHWHPRSPTMRAVWRELGVTSIDDVGCVLAACSLLIADNTSVMYEAAALGRPVLALNAPWYRRNVHHGLRFWSHVPGWQVDDIDAFVALDLSAYVAEDWSRPERLHANAYCFAPNLGHAGPLAAAWIAELVASL